MSEYLTMVPFSATDWDAFAGAQRGTIERGIDGLGETPLINSPRTPMTVNGMEFAVIVDGPGVQLVSMHTRAVIIYTMPLTNMALGLLIARALPATTTHDILEALGFDRNI